MMQASAGNIKTLFHGLLQPSVPLYIRLPTFPPGIFLKIFVTSLVILLCLSSAVLLLFIEKPTPPFSFYYCVLLHLPFFILLLLPVTTNCNSISSSHPHLSAFDLLLCKGNLFAAPTTKERVVVMEGKSHIGIEQ